MTDANTLFLKLYYVYTIQRRGLEQLVHKLKEGGHEGLINFNTAYVRSLMTDQQKELWPVWVEEISSPTVANHMDQLEFVYGVLSDIPKCTHLQEIIPETKTILTIIDTKK